MDWKFTIIDRFDNQTEIDEPTGFDQCQIQIKRDLEKHGIVFDYLNNDFSFYGESMRLLKEEYEKYGVEGKMQLVIELNCGNNELEELYRGYFVFGQYRFTCSDACFVKIPIETTSDVISFTNRFDQKVDLKTPIAFDEQTPLTNYARLGFDVVLPSKGILIKDESQNLVDRENFFVGTLINVTDFPDFMDSNLGYHQLEFGMTNEIASEIGMYGFGTENRLIQVYERGNTPPETHGDVFTYALEDPNNPAVPCQVGLWPLASSPILNYSSESNNYGQVNNPIKIEFNISGTFKNPNTYYGSIVFLLLKLADRPNKSDNGEVETDYERLYERVIYSIGNDTSLLKPPNTPIDISMAGTVLPNLISGDRVYMFLALFEFKSQANLDAVNAGDFAMSFKHNKDSFFRVTNVSHTAPTLASVFMVNETLSRITEAITNNRMRVLSDYFGRIDSEPYSLDEDGCGSLEAITKGLFIRRQEKRIPNEPFLMTVSMKDMWEGLNPIHHIGFGIESDPFRPGNKLVRVEHWKHFYNEDVIMACEAVDKTERRVIEQEIYATFKFGYDKWEAEEFNGLDEFLTKRAYRTTLSEVKNELTQSSKFIASGYAWETTRRKGNTESKDWRYDNDTFLACVERYDASRFDMILAGYFMHTFFTTSTEPVGLKKGDIVNITGSTSNDGEYIVLAIADFGGGFDWGIQLSRELTTEMDATIHMTLVDQGFTIELGNISGAVNIVDPDTLYNYRLSPVRNALRWLDKIMSSYRQYKATNKILFTDGDGNYYAKGMMVSSFCQMNTGHLAENSPLSPNMLKYPDLAKPILAPERIEFNYPMNLKDFKRVLQNPYGKIQFNSSECEEDEGWIDTVTYKPETGMASFNLIPKYLLTIDDDNNEEDPDMKAGMVVGWSGDVSAIPEGWALCDGGGSPARPDMRGLFVVGYDPADTDYNAIGKSGGVKAVTLNASTMPIHGHRVQKGLGGTSPNPIDNPISGFAGMDTTAGFIGSSTGSSNWIEQSGGGQPHENRPPYYTLAYIVKL